MTSCGTTHSVVCSKITKTTSFRPSPLTQTTLRVVTVNFWSHTSTLVTNPNQTLSFLEHPGCKTIKSTATVVNSRSPTLYPSTHYTLTSEVSTSTGSIPLPNTTPTMMCTTLPLSPLILRMESLSQPSILVSATRTTRTTLLTSMVTTWPLSLITAYKVQTLTHHALPPHITPQMLSTLLATTSIATTIIWPTMVTREVACLCSLRCV